MKRVLTLMIVLAACLTIKAQYVVSDKYNLWFEDSGHEITTRKSEQCTDHYQDLRNGCQVRLSGRTVYIYRNGYSILYGDDLILLNDGRWKCVRGSYVTYIE